MKENNHKKLAKKSEDGTIKQEIRKLKQLMENNRIFVNRQLENNGKLNYLMGVPEPTEQHANVCKAFESYDCFWKDKTWFGRRIQMTIETKIISNRIPCNVKGYLKKQKTEIFDNHLQPASCNFKGSIISHENETNFEKNLAHFNNSERNAKSDKMQRFLKNISKNKIINQDEKEIAKCTMYIVNRMDLLEGDKKKVRQSNSPNKAECMSSSTLKSSEIRPYTLNEKKKLEQAWKLWRNFTLARKQRGTERETIENKIDAFLTRVQERIEVENFLQKKKLEKNTKNFKDLKRTNENLKGRTKERMYKKEKKLMEKNGEKEPYIKEIIGEINTSRKETYERLLTFERPGKMQRSKVLKIIASVSENVDKTPKIVLIPKFSLRMEKRRKECRNHRKNIRERIKKLEEERKNNLKEKKRQVKGIEEFLKKKKLHELKERKKVDEEKRKKEKIKIKLAEVHYERTLLRSYGLRPWLYFINLRNLQQLRSLNFFREKLMRRVFTKWKIFVANQVEEKQMKMTNIYHSILQKNCLNVWIKIREERIRQCQAAIDLYDLKITEKVFTKWLKFIQDEQLNYFNKIEIADLHYVRKLKVTFLRKWKNYPQIQRLETAKEERKRIWRQKVKQVLPDYQPIKVANGF